MAPHTQSKSRHVSPTSLLSLSLIFSVYRCLAPGPTSSVWLSDVLLSSVGLAALTLLLGILSFARNRRTYARGTRLLNCALAYASALVLLCAVIPAARPRPTARRDYEGAAHKFRREGSWLLLPGQRKALAAAKSALEQQLGAPVRGAFSIARARTGYQVNFHGLLLKTTDGDWREVPEGHGTVYLSRECTMVETCIGP